MKILKKMLIPFLILAAVALCLGVTAFADPASEPLVIYLGSDEAVGGDGTSASSPLGMGSAGDYTDAPLYRAWSQIIASGKTEAVIVFTDTYTIEDADSFLPLKGDFDVTYFEQEQHREITITYTSKWNGVDYRETNNAKLTFDGRACLTFPTTTRTENLTVQGNQNLQSGRHCWIAGGFCELYLGNGTNFLPSAGAATEFPMVVGGYRNVSNAYGGITHNHQISNGNMIQRDWTKITVDLGEGNEMGELYGVLGMGAYDVSANSNIIIKSGTVKSIVGDMWGSVLSGNGNTGDVAITIDGGAIKGQIAATNNGLATENKPVTITINGGDFSACTGIIAKGIGSFYAPTLTVDCSKASNAVYQAVLALVEEDADFIAPGRPENTTTGVRYNTVAEACDAAKSGETIKMYANASEDVIIIPEGVSLNLSEYTLTANKVFAMDGATIGGSTASAKLVVAKNRLFLSESAYVVGEYSLLPVWNDGGYYTFAAAVLSTNAGGMTMEENVIRFKFAHMFSASAAGAIGDACSDNGLSIILQLRWDVGGNMAVQNFHYSDVYYGMVATGGNYTFSLSEYDELNIDGTTVELQPMIVTESGVVMYGETWVNGAIKSSDPAGTLPEV